MGTVKRFFVIAWIFGWSPALWGLAAVTGWWWLWLVSIYTLLPVVGHIWHRWLISKGTHIELDRIEGWEHITLAMVNPTVGDAHMRAYWGKGELAMAGAGVIVFRDVDAITTATLFHELRHQQQLAWFGPWLYVLYWAFPSYFERDADDYGALAEALDTREDASAVVPASLALLDFLDDIDFT